MNSSSQPNTGLLDSFRFSELRGSSAAHKGIGSNVFSFGKRSNDVEKSQGLLASRLNQDQLKPPVTNQIAESEVGPEQLQSLPNPYDKQPNPRPRPKQLTLRPQTQPTTQDPPQLQPPAATPSSPSSPLPPVGQPQPQQHQQQQKERPKEQQQQQESTGPAVPVVDICAADDRLPEYPTDDDGEYYFPQDDQSLLLRNQKLLNWGGYIPLVSHKIETIVPNQQRRCPLQILTSHRKGSSQSRSRSPTRITQDLEQESQHENQANLKKILEAESSEYNRDINRISKNNAVLALEKQQIHAEETNNSLLDQYESDKRFLRKQIRDIAMASGKPRENPAVQNFDTSDLSQSNHKRFDTTSQKNSHLLDSQAPHKKSHHYHNSHSSHHHHPHSNKHHDFEKPQKQTNTKQKAAVSTNLASNTLPAYNIVPVRPVQSPRTQVLEPNEKFLEVLDSFRHVLSVKEEEAAYWKQQQEMLRAKLESQSNVGWETSNQPRERIVLRELQQMKTIELPPSPQKGPNWQISSSAQTSSAKRDIGTSANWDDSKPPIFWSVSGRGTPENDSNMLPTKAAWVQPTSTQLRPTSSTSTPQNNIVSRQQQTAPKPQPPGLHIDLTKLAASLGTQLSANNKEQSAADETAQLREELERVSRQMRCDVADKDLEQMVLRRPSADTLDLLEASRD